jgi:hypothetical protein
MFNRDMPCDFAGQNGITARELLKNNYNAISQTSLVIGYYFGRWAQMIQQSPAHNDNHVIPVQNYSSEQMKAIIKDYFDKKHGENIDYGDLMDEFNFPLPMIVKLCEELEQEGKIVAID